MKLVDVVNRSPAPEPWAEGDNIPWNDPGFSARMLKEHLSQDHDAASRRAGKIDQHVAWMHNQVLHGRPARILDLGCGPGLYACRLARLGHDCTGIDFSPASIAYAAEQAAKNSLACRFRLQDIRSADYGEGYDLAMLIFGELNVFRPADAELILRKAHRALAPGGILLLEPHTFEAVQQIGRQTPAWRSRPSGLFSARPHLVLEENVWDAVAQAATTRYYVVDAATGEVIRHAQSFQAYDQAGYTRLLAACGFGDPRFFPSLTGGVDETQDTLLAIVARA